MNKEPKETTLIVGGTASVGTEILTRLKSSSSLTITTYSSQEQHFSEKSIICLHLDLTNDESIAKFIEDLSGLTAQINTLISLAGVLPGKSLDSYTFSEIEQVMDINFIGQAKLLQRLLPMFVDTASILLFSSISGQRGSFDPIYAASKGAVLSFVKAMSSQLPLGARINAIAPGLIQDSAMYDDMAPERREHHRRSIRSGVLLSRKNLANVVFDICQGHWSHFNGACLDLNGGQYVR